MKRIIIIIILTVLFIAACVGARFADMNREVIPNNKPAGEYYALTTRVEDISEAADRVLVEDSNGNLWAFKGVEDWQIGDCASLLMWDSGTENIKDDEIISARYNSWDLEKN